MEPITALLCSVQVGKPQHYTNVVAKNNREQVWETSFFRTPENQPRWLYKTHLAGNEQADTKNHGTPGQAVLSYAATHYPLWQAELDQPEIGPGGFGENFTIDGLDEELVCVGDIYAVGEARIQVTGPRYPCWKIERRWGIEGLTARVAASGRTGWYAAVLQEGMIEPGLPVQLLERPYPGLTMALINDFGHGRNRDVDTAQTIAACPILPEFWGRLIASQSQGKD